MQEIKVEVTGESFKMTEKRKVMFKSYDTLVLIQPDKPIYNPGQTGNSFNIPPFLLKYLYN